MINTGTTALTLTYPNSYTDVSYNFYNQKGQLVASIAPEGVKKLYTNGVGAYSSRSAIPFTTLYTYDVRGRVVSRQDPDKGTVQSRGTNQYVYRNDGKIRFSQSPAQAQMTPYPAFSYVNYDALDRPIESGQYTPDANGIAFGSAPMTSILENTSPGGGLTTGTKTDVNLVQYDLSDNSYYTNTNSSVLSGYVQDAANLGGGVSVTWKYSSIVNNSPSISNLISATWNNYDEEGKAVWAIKYVNGLGTGQADAASYKTVDYSYDPLGNITKKVYQAGTPAETFVHYYDYDPVNKHLWHVYTNTTDNSSTKTLQATYYYYLHGGAKRVELAGNLQGIDYTYTLQGKLKSVNNSNSAQDPGGDGSGNGFSADAFGEVLDYYTGDYTNGRGGVPVVTGVNSSAVPAFSTGGVADSYAGNIKAMSWFSQKPASSGASSAPTSYVYQYDPKYQFTNSTWGTGLNFGSSPASYTATGFNQETIGNSTTPAYDGNGNIQYLQRTNASGALTDQFSYQYGNSNNQLTSVINTANSQTYATYTYNANGQLSVKSVTGSNPVYLAYDVTGKVTGVYQDAPHTLPIVTFVYDETGRRVKKLSYNVSAQLIQVTFYIGDVTYTQPVTGGSTYGAVTAVEYQLEGTGRKGIYYPQGPVYAYELTDHLGSVRAVIAVNAGTMQVRAYSDYYPFGMVLAQGGTSERYGYQGHFAESDPETGWNAFELRMYDSRIGRWQGYDPKRQFCSPYIGMGNEPVGSTDPDGGGTDDYIRDKQTGSIFWSNYPDLYANLARYDNLGASYMADGYIFSYNDDEGHVTSKPLFDPYAFRPTISSYTPGFWQRQEQGNIVQNFFYNTLNSFYVTAQNLGYKQLKGRSWAVNLNGSLTTPNQNVMAFAGSVPIPEAEMLDGFNAVERELPVLPSLSRMTEDQIALKDLVDDATLGGRKAMSMSEAQAAMDLAEDVGYPGFTRDAADFSTVGNHWVGGPHFNLAGVGNGHIMVIP